MKNIIVLGATGQLGANCVKYLKEQGNQVVAVGHRESDNGFFSTLGVEYIGGFALEKRESFKKLPCEGIDAVVHMAGTMPAHSDQMVFPYLQSIVIGMANVCEWMKHANIKRIVFNTTPSDVNQYFGTDRPVEENATRSFPQDGGDHAVYAIAKNTAVDLLTFYQQACGIEPCVFRHLTVYGWHPNASYYLNGVKKVLPFRRIIRSCLAGNPVEIWGDPNRKKELLYIKDFTEAVCLAVNSHISGLFNLPGDRPYTLEEQIDGFVAAFSPKEKKSNKIYCPEKDNTPQNLLLLGKAKSLLGWSPKWDWFSACEDMRKEMIDNPFELLWGQNAPEDTISDLLKIERNFGGG